MEYRGSKSIFILIVRSAIQIILYLIIIYFLLISLADIDQTDIFKCCFSAPVINYLNANLDKGKILKDNYSKSGVYR